MTNTFMLIHETPAGRDTFRRRAGPLSLARLEERELDAVAGFFVNFDDQSYAGCVVLALECVGLQRCEVCRLEAVTRAGTARGGLRGRDAVNLDRVLGLSVQDFLPNHVAGNGRERQ